MRFRYSLINQRGLTIHAVQYGCGISVDYATMPAKARSNAYLLGNPICKEDSNTATPTNRKTNLMAQMPHCSTPINQIFMIHCFTVNTHKSTSSYCLLFFANCLSFYLQKNHSHASRGMCFVFCVPYN